MKLWKKGYELNKEIEKFTVGNDHFLDGRLVWFDCLASIAHAEMLGEAGILTKAEVSKLARALRDVMALAEKGKFEIKPEDEDCHTAIENYLTAKCGDAGKKIHTARSRNDQVLTAIRLYEKFALNVVAEELKGLRAAIAAKAKGHGKARMPGYTHMQRAMPMPVKDWLGSYEAAIDDDLKMIDAVLDLIDQSPLGTAAGFGVPVLDIDREMTAKEMGFARVMENPVYAQLSRGKFEASVVHALSQIMLDLNRLATDLIVFSTKEFGFVSLPAELCTGSSIMPQKKNPDVLELIRAKYHVVTAEEFKIRGIAGNLISGYHRDLQLTKEPLFDAFDATKASIGMMALVVSGMKLDAARCEKAMTPELFATEEAYKLVKKGVPFREAYRKVAKKYGEK